MSPWSHRTYVSTINSTYFHLAKKLHIYFVATVKSASNDGHAPNLQYVYPQWLSYIFCAYQNTRYAWSEYGVKISIFTIYSYVLLTWFQICRLTAVTLPFLILTRVPAADSTASFRMCSCTFLQGEIYCSDTTKDFFRKGNLSP